MFSQKHTRVMKEKKEKINYLYETHEKDLTLDEITDRYTINRIEMIEY
jgi:hypothetical protein